MADGTRPIGVGDLLRSAIAALRIGGRAIVVCLGVWVALETGLNMVDKVFDPARVFLFSATGVRLLDVRQLDYGAFQIVKNMIGGIPYSAVRAILMVVILRIMLTGPGSILSLGAREIMRAILAIFLINLTWAVLIGLGDLLIRAVDREVTGYNAEGPLYVATAFAVYAVLAWMMCRFSMAYPSCALGEGWRLIESWRLTRDAGFKLSAVVVLIFFVLIVAFSFVEILIVGDTSAPRLDIDRAWAASVNEAIAGALISATLMASFAVAFTRRTGFPAAGIPGATRTPKQLAETF